MTAHRLTLVPWTEHMGTLTPREEGQARALGRLVVPRQELRWTAACDCGWHACTAEPGPHEVLVYYREHLDELDELAALPELPDPEARVWLLRFADERGDSVNSSSLTCGETLAEVQARQAAGYWPEGRPGAWSPSHPDVWCWADELDPTP